MADNEEEKKAPGKAGRPEMTPEQEAEMAAKKAARAEAKAKGQKGAGGKGKGAAAPKEVAMERVKRDKPARLRSLYDAEIRTKLMQEFSLANRMQAPKLTRITINMGLGEAVSNPKLLDSAVDELGAITGQRPVVTRAKKSIAIFKLRAGQKIGAMVTLRGERMYEFLDRLISIALPRVRDFRGVSPKGFDGRGNYTLGLRDQLLFPEIDYMKVDKARGMNVSVVTTARTDEEARKLLQLLGMPFRTN